jgi:hypothetical protein
VRCKDKHGKCLLISLISDFKFDIHVCTVFARQVLVQSSSSSRARNKRVMNQTMFDVPDPLVVHVLFLTHEFIYNVICLPQSWYPHVTVHVFYVPKITDDSPSLWRLAGIMSQLCPREKHKSEKKLNRTIQMQM